jgi:AraC-like DNA-binding protein
VIERLCNYIDGNLTGAITMSDLERESGLKSRAIQLGFQRHFTCTPTEWILNRRLDAARRMLIAGSGEPPDCRDCLPLWIPAAGSIFGCLPATLW